MGNSGSSPVTPSALRDTGSLSATPCRSNCRRSCGPSPPCLRTILCRGIPLPVHLSQHDVDAAEDNDDIRDLVAEAHIFEGCQVDEARWPDVIPVRHLAAFVG